jgi:hypothetical protein
LHEVLKLGIAAKIPNQDTDLVSSAPQLSESRDRSWDVVLREERHDSNLGKTSVVKLCVSLSLHGNITDTREVNLREDHGGEFSSLHVVSSLVTLRVKLGNEDGSQDLSLTGGRDGSPGFGRAQLGERLEANVTGGGEHTGEVDSGSVDEVSGGGNHGATSVLEFGGAEPGEGLIRSQGGEVEGIEVGERGGTTGHLLEAQSKLRGSRLVGHRGKGGGRADEGSDDGSLHGVVFGIDT